MGLTSIEQDIPPGVLAYEKRVKCSSITREWVSLESILWTLDPHLLYPKVFEKHWEDAQNDMVKIPEFQLRFEKLKAVAEYYDAQLRLYSQLLLGRSLACMHILSRQFSYELLLSGITNDHLPYSIRTSFSEMLHRLYVDRFPHEPLELPQLVRESHHIEYTSESHDQVRHTFVSILLQGSDWWNCYG